MKTGRNDPCPCGSGKKFKKCCLGKGEVSDLGYTRLSHVQQELVEKFIKYVMQELGERYLLTVLGEFFQDDSDPSSMWDEAVEEFGTVFWPWLFYTLEMNEYDIEDFELAGLIEPDTTVAEMYLQKKGRKLSSIEQELISAANRTPFSFFEVETVQPGLGFQAVDLLTGKRHKVTDVSASEGLEQGDVLYALIAEAQGYALCIGIAPYKFYPRFKLSILRFREELKEGFGVVTDEVLLEAGEKLRDFFFYLHDALFEPPEMTNTDGEPLSFRRLHYSIDSPEDAFQALAPLCTLASEDELRSEAELDASGQVHRIEFSWSREGHALSKGMENTVLGSISIEGKQMTVDVNSEGREKRIKEEIDSRMGSRAAFKVTDIRSLESLMEEGAAGSGAPEMDEDALQQTPEVQEAIKEVLTQHWQGWLDTAIPALKGKTPREAVRSAHGREAVQTLLRDIEASDARSNMPVSQQPYVDWAKRELGLSDT